MSERHGRVRVAVTVPRPRQPAGPGRARPNTPTVPAARPEGWTPCAEDPESWWSHDKTDQQHAARVCRTACPRQSFGDCRTYALTARPLEGVWAGTTPDDRRQRRR